MLNGMLNIMHKNKNLEKTNVKMIRTQNTNKNDNMLDLDLSLFSIFCNFHKKQEILVDNKIGNQKIKITKKGTKNGSKKAKDTRKITKKSKN